MTSSASASSTASWMLVDAARRVLRRRSGRLPSARLSSVAESGKRSGYASWSVWQDVVRDPGADDLEQHGRRHRQPEPEHRLVGLLDRVAVLEGVHQHRALSAEQAVDDERRRVADENARLRSFSVTAQAVASVTSSVCGVRTSSTSGSTATGLKKCMPTTRSGCSRLGAHLGDRERRGVRREHALRRDDALELGEHLLLDGHLLEDRLEDEVAACEDVPPGPAGDERAEEARLALAEAALRDELGELAAIHASASSTCSCVTSRSDDRDLEPPQEEQRELAGHQPGADDADLLDAARLGLGDPDAALRAALDEVEGVDRRLRLRRREQVGEASSSAR